MLYIINLLMADLVTWEVGVVESQHPQLVLNILIPGLQVLLKHHLTPPGLLVLLTCQEG